VRRVRFSRSHAIVRLRHRLEEESYPRLQMGLIVALTGAAGLLCSYAMLRLGLDTMALRYPLALGGAYLVFLLLLWLWLRTRAEDYFDLPDPNLMPSGDGVGTASPPPFASGQGGDFGGGGASASFDAPIGDGVSAASDGLPSIGKAAGAALEGDELAIPLLAVVLAIGLALASLYVVYIAPVLFAELLFDGVLSYSLYRHLRHADSSHWVTTAFQRTVLPFVLTAIFLCIVGAGLAAYAPGARSIGDVVRHGGASSR